MTVMHLQLVLSSFQKAIERTLEGSPRPPVIINEANKLTSWSVTHPEELMTLLIFFCRCFKG